MRHSRPNLFSVLALGPFLFGSHWVLAVPDPAAAQLTDDLFVQYEVVTGSAERQTVLTGFLLGGAIADLAVVNIDENDDRRLRIYTFGDGTWSPKLDATLGPEVLFVDVANIGGRDRLITYESGRLNWFDPDSATERMLVAVTSDFNPPPRGEILHVDIARDPNNDDLDDLVVPHSHGFWVFIQMEGGVFADQARELEVAMPADEEYTWLVDLNKDGKQDILMHHPSTTEPHRVTMLIAR